MDPKKKNSIGDEEDYMRGDFGSPSDDEHDLGFKKMPDLDSLPSPEEMIKLVKAKRMVLVTFTYCMMEEEMYEEIPLELDEGYTNQDILEAIVEKFTHMKDSRHLIRINKTIEKRY